jgi:CheY-like chemotaxis protein
VLEDAGYSALLADSGRAAIQLLLQDPEAVTAMLLDMTMPGMTPQDTVRMAREIHPGLPVIIVSGDTEASVRQRFASGTIDGYLSKPDLCVELEGVLSSVLNRKPETNSFSLARISDSEMREAQTDYLAKCKADLLGLDALLAAQNFDSLRILGHTLKGSGGCFGLPEVTRIGKSLEEQAIAVNLRGCQSQIELLRSCLESIGDPV